MVLLRRKDVFFWESMPKVKAQTDDKIIVKIGIIIYSAYLYKNVRK
jgi:hypothetical protein